MSVLSYDLWRFYINYVKETKAAKPEFRCVGGWCSGGWGGWCSRLVARGDGVLVGGVGSNVLLSLIHVLCARNRGTCCSLALLCTCCTFCVCRAILSQTYEFTLQHVGLDPRSTSIWQEYLHFLKEG